MTQTSSTPPPSTATVGPMRRIVRRHPLAAFFTLSCALSWWPALLYVRGLSPQPIAGFGPFLAVLVVLAMTQGRAAIGRLLRSMVTWRVPKRAYAAAIGVPLLLSGAAVATLILTGARPDPATVGLWTDIPLTIVLGLLIPGLGGTWEEPGFRGYALQRLERRFGMLAGPLLLGVFWIFWHLPLFLTGQILPTDVLTIMAASVVIAAVFHAGRESVLIAMLLHATNNAVGGSYASQVFHGDDALRVGMLTAAGWSLLAIVVILRKRATVRRLDAAAPPAIRATPGASLTHVG